METTLPSVVEVAQSIDHAILKPDFTYKQVDDELIEADRLKVFSVCVRPSDVEYAVEFLKKRNSSVVVGTVVGFPHGANTVAVKMIEAVEAIRNGASEVDVVVNISDVVSGRIQDVVEEMTIISSAVKEASGGVGVVKVIFETAYLTSAQVAELSVALQSAGVDFIKTSTGFASAGATKEDVSVMCAMSGSMEVKASGGIRDLDTYLLFRELGVTRFGTSNANIILEDLEARLSGSEGTGRVGVEY